jgi:hypothetical protein
MKVAVSFLYIVLSILYLTVGDSSTIWGATNIITQIGFIGYLCFLLQKSHKGHEQLFFQYLTGLSIANCGYIIACVIRNKDWILYNTSLFAYILAVGFLVFLFHLALKNT